MIGEMMVAPGRLPVWLGALVFAVSAWAAPVAQGFTWNVKEWKAGPPPVSALAAGESEGSALALSAGKVVLEGEVLGAKLKIEAAGLSSINDKIEQGAANALNPGKIVFENAVVTEPAIGCAVSKGKIETNELSGELVKVGGVFYDKLTPPVAAPIAVVKIELCAIAGNFPLKGEEFGEMGGLAGGLLAQPMKFSPAILLARGGAITLGANPAQLTFESEVRLNNGKEFWAA